MTTMHLYEIADARQILETWLLESDGELTPEIEALLAEVDGKADDKIERVALFIREQRAMGAAAKEERDRLSAVVKRRETAAASLTLYLQREMERLGKDKVSGVLVTVALQKNPPSVKGDLPDDALRFAWEKSLLDPSVPAIVRHSPESFTLDRKAILDLYKLGQPIPDGLTVEQSSSLRIR